ncbi:putative ferric-chelate reductase 1 isoform X3 [Mercenaria mercenaria]|uniref:putative ferric-chelate reductase 1 isoform X3 n=1 Tax=Mercenaria mercenaria TaxID=6596 RepID=UPI00234F0099|nr:putative ferric-chelate reductase 1 isoform X3 [Mercenaria mercenaria]
MDMLHFIHSTNNKGGHFIAATLCVVLSIFHQCSPYPTGAPLVACQEMRPYHPPTTTSGAPPFAINLTSSVYKPGSEIKGTIYSPSGVVFRGFLIQARKADNSSTTPFGEFIVTGTDTHTNCGDANKQGLTHTTNSNKTKIDFTWKAPMSSQGDVHFKMTIVESYNVSRYWLSIYSSVVQDCSLHPSSDCNEITTKKPTTRPVETTGTSPSETTGTVSPITSTPKVITTQTPGKKIPNDPGCGTTKGCFPDCSGGCDYLVTWQQTPQNGIRGVNFDFQMMMKDMDNVWIAIGFSPTGKMDETNVIACLSGNGVTVESSHNEGYSNVMYQSKTMGLSNMQGTARDGKIACSFTREISMNVSDFMNLKDEAYLLVGTGPVVNGIKQQHTKLPKASSSKVNFLSNKVSKESDSATPLIKLHGSLMVLAWVLCSSVGVVVARHCKSMMQSKMLCGVRYWFAVHRTLMFVVVLCVVVAFVAIFYEVGGFSKISAEPGREYTKAHPYLGIIVTAFTLLNPIMAFFRPSPDHKNRPVFNWAHFSVGTAAHIIAVVTIFFGIKLSKAKVDEYAMYVMIIYSVIFVLVQFILEVHRRRITSTGAVNYGKLNSNSVKYGAVASIHMTSTRKAHIDESEETKEETSKFSNVVLFVHAILMVAAATFLVLNICIPSHFHVK